MPQCGPEADPLTDKALCPWWSLPCDVVGLKWGRVPPARWRALPAEVWVLVVARTVNRLGAFTLPFLTVVLVDDFGTPVATPA